VKTPILALAGPAGAPSNTLARFVPPASGHNSGSWAASPGVPCPMPCAGTITNLYARFPTAIASGTWDIVVMKAGSTTAVTCQVANGVPVASDTTHSVTFAAGDTFGFQTTPTGSPTAQTNPVQISCLFEGTTAGESVLFAVHQGSATGGYFVQIGATNDTSGTEVQRQIVAPTDGVISSMYIALTTAVGASGTRTYTLRKNGADTSLTYTFSAGSAATGNVTGTPVTITAGDLLCISVAITGTPASSNASFGLNWLPTVDGESIATGSFVSAISTASSRYGNMNGQTLGGVTVEGDVANIAPFPFTARKIAAQVTTAPGGGTSRDFVLRQAGASTSLTTQIAGASTYNANTGSVSVAAGDLINVMTTPNSTPAGTNTSRASLVMYISPGGTRQMTLLGAG